MPEINEITSALSETTRKERRLLLITSVILLIVVQGGLRPTKIAALGVDFAPIHFRTLLIVLFAIHIFVLCAFTIAAGAEGRSWEFRFSSVRQEVAKQIHNCRAKITDGTLQPGEKLSGAIDLLRQMLNDTHAHLRSTTVKDTEYTLSVAGIARNCERTRQQPESKEWFDSYATADLVAVDGLQPAHAGIYRALLQRELYYHYAEIMRAKTVRALLVRLVYGKTLKAAKFGH